MNFDIEKYKGKYVMHCKTKEEAEDFCKYLDSIGRTWNSGANYKNNFHWNEYGPKTIYWFNHGLYDFLSSVTRKKAIILEWSDFMEEKEKEESKCSNKPGIDYSKEVFELLGIKPNEVFNIKGSYEGPDYRITEELMLLYYRKNEEWLPSAFSLTDILNGELAICKKPIPTEMEQLAVDYALACGCHWLAKDKDGIVYAYKDKPEKKLCEWSYSNIHIHDDFLEIGLPISFISWEDDEPYYIGD